MSRDLIRILRQQPTVLQRVRVATVAAGLNFSQLADQAGVNPSLLSRCLHGKQPLSDTHKANLAAVLGLPQNVLFPDASEAA
jgi:transcriptional regulator with XRE-family HTH domain